MFTFWRKYLCNFNMFCKILAKMKINKCLSPVQNISNLRKFWNIAKNQIKFCISISKMFQGTFV